MLLAEMDVCCQNPVAPRQSDQIRLINVQLGIHITGVGKKKSPLMLSSMCKSRLGWGDYSLPGIFFRITSVFFFFFLHSLITGLIGEVK